MSIWASRRRALCRRFDPCTPNRTKPFNLLGGTILTAVFVLGLLTSLPESGSSCDGVNEWLSEASEAELPMDDADPELRSVLGLELFSDDELGFFLCEEVDCVAASLFTIFCGGTMPVLESTVQCRCPRVF